MSRDIEGTSRGWCGNIEEMGRAWRGDGPPSNSFIFDFSEKILPGCSAESRYIFLHFLASFCFYLKMAFTPDIINRRFRSRTKLEGLMVGTVPTMNNV